MHIRSLGRRTDLIFAKFSGAVIDKGSYTLVQTPSNPGYHWGNYIIFDRAPRKGDLKEWTSLFRAEFPYYEQPQHYVFTWDTGRNEKGEFEEFLDANFEMDSGIVLTTRKLKPPSFVNNEIEIKKIQSTDEWEEVIKLQTLCADPKFLNEYYEPFKRTQMAQYRKMSESGKGSWFGAFIENVLVGDLGVFYEAEIGRYQNVGTHPDHRRKGICGTLVYKSGQIALKEFGVRQLVMEADPEYHAARIYESVGFKKNEVNHSLCWWKSKD